MTHHNNDLHKSDPTSEITQPLLWTRYQNDHTGARRELLEILLVCADDPSWTHHTHVSYAHGFDQLSRSPPLGVKTALYLNSDDQIPEHGCTTVQNCKADRLFQVSTQKTKQSEL